MGFIRSTICVLVILASVRAVAADTLDEVVSKLDASDAKIKSCTAKIRMTQDMDMGDGNSVKSTSDGMLEWVTQGGKKLFRTDMKTSGTQKFGGEETKSEQIMQMISDGVFSYVVSETGGVKSAFKQKVDPDLAASPKVMLDGMKEGYALQLLPDDKVDGAECFVIEGTAKEAPLGTPAKQTLYFRKDSGLCVKMLGKDKSDKEMFTQHLSDVKLNADIPADHFVFKAPEGVQVVDMTQSAPDKQP